MLWEWKGFFWTSFMRTDFAIIFSFGGEMEGTFGLWELESFLRIFSPLGLYQLYHQHGLEFHKVQGKTSWRFHKTKQRFSSLWQRLASWISHCLGRHVYIFFYHIILMFYQIKLSHINHIRLDCILIIKEYYQLMLHVFVPYLAQQLPGVLSTKSKPSDNSQTRSDPPLV